MENVTEYFNLLIETLERNEWVIHRELTFRQIDHDQAYIRGELYIRGGFILHVAEYVILRDNDTVTRLKYRYQLQDHRKKFITRWDNAPHHGDIPTRPFHKHLEDGSVTPSPRMSIPDVLLELDGILID